MCRQSIEGFRLYFTFLLIIVSTKRRVTHNPGNFRFLRSSCRSEFHRIYIFALAKTRQTTMGGDVFVKCPYFSCF
jgi:hypothetical protein